ncbi:MAG: bifunctional metallophosphatase/5'-nucleotidase [Spirochaetes bacterium]|nr:bifunctional metallophosphatase/5'-nucleotidase [Spirochaetota bacterium]
MDRKLTFVHTNDMHSHLLGFPPMLDYTPGRTGDDGTRGGWARIMTVIRNARAERDNPILVVDAGDFTMGTLFHMVCRERALELRLMKRMGYDAVTLGNHEFDLKPDGLARMLDAARRNGGLPPVVSSNVIFNTSDPRDDTLKKAFDEGLVRPYRVVERSGVRIGFFGLVGKDAAEVSPFAAPVSFGDAAETARAMSALLRNREKVDLVVCLSHGGLVLNDLSASEDVRLAREAPDIDIIISGHTHTALPKPIVQGKTIIVQAWCYGLWAGILDVTADGGRARLDGYRIVEIDDRIAGDAGLTGVIDGYRGEVGSAVLSPLGLKFDSIVARTPFDLDFVVDESPVGNLITDASRWYANRFVYDPRDPATKIVAAFDSNGIIRAAVAKGKTGRISAADLFSSLPLGFGPDGTMGYPLVAVYLHASEIKKALEVPASIYPIKGEDYFLQISGLRYTCNPHRMIFDRVTGIEIGSDEEGYWPLDYSTSNKKLYHITANYYNASFLKIVGDFTMNILNIVPKDRNGRPIEDLATAIVDVDPHRPGIQEAKQWVGLLEYVRGFDDANGDGYPDMPERYRKKLGRIVSQPSLCPVSLLRRGTWITWSAFGVILVVVALAGVVAFAIVKRVRRRRGA